MTTALDRLRSMVGAARRDSLIATAEADILDRLARVAEDEEDDRLDGALEELADNLRRALDKCVDRDADNLASTGCPTCDAVLDILGECHGMSLRGTTAAEVAASALDWINDLIVERNEARAEVERLRAEVASLRRRPTRDELADYARRMQTAYTSAPTVGATDAGPDAPALIVEGDDGTGAREARAVPATPVSGAEQSCGETGADRPRDDERIAGPREGEDWIGMGKHAGTSPYGYDVDTSGDDPVLVTHQVEADTMLLLCEWRDAGVSAQTMAKRLNDIGRRTRSGCVWTASSVRSRLLSSGSGYDEWHEVGR